MPQPEHTLPYFDQLLQHLKAGDPELERCFGRHVHWGYWTDPAVSATQARQSYAAAAEALTTEMLNLAAIHHGDAVLDVGCGFGGTVALLNEQQQGLNLTGVNLDPRQLERASRRVQASNGNQIQWISADACALPLASASQDLVLAVECIFHFPSRDRFLAEVRRVLRPGGRLVLSDFVPVAPLAWLLRRRGNTRLHTPTYGPVDCSWGWRQYRERGLLQGLELLHNRNITANTLPTYGVVTALFDAMGWPAATADTARIAQLSRAGLLRYRLLCFRRLADG